jgi:hypothetical protein
VLSDIKQDVIKMTSQVYENLETLTYRELLTAINNIKEKIYSNQTIDFELIDMQYYIALVQELDKRQKEI